MKKPMECLGRSAELDALVLRCLGKEPEGRPTTRELEALFESGVSARWSEKLWG